MEKPCITDEGFFLLLVVVVVGIAEFSDPLTACQH